MQQRPTTMESFMQSFWAVLGACSGVLIGISKEGVDLLSSLRSIQGWKQIYTGTSPTQTKKIDNGNRPSAYSQAPPKSGQDEIKQFLGTRPPELKTPRPTTGAYSTAPILGGQPAAPVPASVPPPMPFASPAGATSRPVLGDPLPDIFGLSTSFLSSRPVSPPPVAPSFTPTSIPEASSPAVISAAPVVSPSRSPAVNGSSASPVSEELPAEDDEVSTADEGSPEAKASTDSKMKKLRKRLSSKLKR